MPERSSDCEPRDDLLRRRGRQPRLRQHGAQRIDIASRRCSSGECGFDDRCATSHERVVHDVAGRREAIDEEPRKLWLETCAIRHLVEAVCRTLPARPELVDECLDDNRSRLRQTDAGDGAPGWAAVPLERAQLADDRGLRRLRSRETLGGVCRIDARGSWGSELYACANLPGTPSELSIGRSVQKYSGRHINGGAGQQCGGKAPVHGDEDGERGANDGERAVHSPRPRYKG